MLYYHVNKQDFSMLTFAPNSSAIKHRILNLVNGVWLFSDKTLVLGNLSGGYLYDIEVEDNINIVNLYDTVILKRYTKLDILLYNLSMVFTQSITPVSYLKYMEALRCIYKDKIKVTEHLSKLGIDAIRPLKNKDESTVDHILLINKDKGKLIQKMKLK